MEPQDYVIKQVHIISVYIYENYHKLIATWSLCTLEGLIQPRGSYPTCGSSPWYKNMTFPASCLGWAKLLVLRNHCD